jgi:hypothetical protein
MRREHSMDWGGMEAVRLAAMQVPNSSGTAGPKLSAPPNAATATCTSTTAAVSAAAAGVTHAAECLRRGLPAVPEAHRDEPVRRGDAAAYTPTTQ